jgi:PAS domain S-box-containing protein
MKSSLTTIAQAKFWQRLWLSLLVGFLVSIITLLLWRSLIEQQSADIQQQVELTTINTSELISQQIETRIQALTRMAERYSVRDGTPIAEWEADARNYVEDYPGYQAIALVDSNFKMQGVVSLAGNEVIEKLNLGTLAQKRTALEAARFRKILNITHTISLAQDGKGFLVYVPIFLDNFELTSAFNIQNPELTQKSLSGFIVGVFRTKPLVDRTLINNVTQKYAIAIFEGKEEIYRRSHPVTVSEIRGQEWAYEKEIKINEIPWRVRVWANSALLNKEQSLLPTVVLGTGLAMAVLLGLSVYLIQGALRYVKQIELVNQVLAREISQRKRTEEELKKYVDEFEDLYNHAPCAYHSLDKYGTFIRANDTELSMLGYTREEIIGKKNFADLLTVESLQIFQENFPFFKQQGFIKDLEFEIIRKDGSILFVSLSATAVKDAADKFVMTRSTIFDISDRQAALRQRELVEEELLWKEALLRSMANSSPLAFYVVDERTNKILYFNHRFCEISGMECVPEQMHQGQLKNTEAGCADCQPISGNTQAFIKACQPFENEDRTVLEDEMSFCSGQVIRRFSAQIRDDKDKYFGRLYLFEDITERKQAEKELRNLSVAMESAVEGISLLDKQLRYRMVNPAYASMLGYQAEEMIGMECILTIHPDERPKMEAVYEQMLVNDKVEVEIRALRKDGTVFDQQAVIIKAYDQNQKFIGWYRFMKDISDRREVERLKDEFVSVVSHELRTPLTSISAALDLLASGVLQTQPVEAQRMLSIASNNTDRLVRLINDILDIERIESGKVEMTKEVCNAADLMSESAEVVQEMAEKAGVTISVSPLASRLWADSDRIIQVITNLLSNAIKFSSSGSTVWLSAELQHKGDVRTRGQGENFTTSSSSSSLSFPIPYLLIKVRDTGRGIPQGKLESIFERFAQVDASDSRSKGGTGLGLAICHSILQHHDGQIWAESTIGEGSTFCFTLPLLPSLLGLELELFTNHNSKKDVNNSPLVMICDDDPDIRAVVQTMLERQGYQVVAVSSGQEAIESAIKQNPKAILLNLMMPDMDGWETLAILKQRAETQNVPVIILSGLFPDATTPNLDVSDWIVKPPNFTLLCQTLEKTLAKQNQGIKVLLIEDDLDLAEVLNTMFSRHEITTFHAQTGKEAIQLSQLILPDLLVLDLGLPEWDGFMVVDWLRQHNRLCQVPLVVYTAYDLDECDRQRLKLGQTLYLTKGRVPPQEFEQRVINLLNRMI